MADYLKLAPYRAGGAGRGCHTANFVSMLEGAVADNSRVTDTVDGSDDGDDRSEGDDNDHDDEADAGDVEEDSDVEDDSRHCYKQYRRQAGLKRKRCHYCPGSKDRKVFTECDSCHNCVS